MPTLNQVRQLPNIHDARRLVKDAPPLFVGYVQDAIVALHNTDPKGFWASGNLVQWQEALEYAVELAEQHDHETSAAGHSPPPTAGPQSDPPLTGEGSGGSDPTTDSGHDA